MARSPIDPDPRRRLPPLILHPIADPSGPAILAESSRASLMLQGIIPGDEVAAETLTRMVLVGRWHEIRMLFYLGKDVARWINQCMDFISRDELSFEPGIRSESFAALLLEDAPREVREKFERWGVVDYKSIFSRALGLNAVFADLPERNCLSDDFVRHYHRYADRLFGCRQEVTPFTKIDSGSFHFDMYASGEYTRMLEQNWEES